MRLLRVAAAALSLTVVTASPAPAQQAFRPPAVPLVTHDPYFSIWATGDRLTERPTTHWTGTPHPMSTLVRIDGRAFRAMGHLPADVPALTQRSVTVLPLRTIYVLEGGGVEVTLTFLSPTLPHDLELVSRPATYVTFQARATDARRHDVGVYFDASGQIAVNGPNQKVAWAAERNDRLQTLRIGTEAQPVLAKDGDNLRIDWGHLYVAAPTASGTTTRIARDIDARRSFVAKGALPETDDPDQPRAMDDRAPVLAVAFAFGSVGAEPVRRHVIVAYDDEWAVEYMGERLRAWWRRNGGDAPAMLRAAADDYARLVTASESYDAALMRDLEQRGGVQFARLAALAFRQTLAAHKLVAHAKTGEALYFSKENFSNGCMGTVDVTYPSSPFFLLFSPKLLAAQLRPVLEYAASPRWKFPFAPHDLGRYPQANGQVYGGGEKTEENQMPVEESGNMLLMLGALATLHDDVSLSKQYWPAIAKWVAYLESKGFDPENQLSTDDFAGHLAHNANLSIKAILAIAAAGDLAGRLGDKPEADRLRTVATGLAAKWHDAAADGDHYRLAFDKPGTWSQKYNLVWDTLLGYRLFPEHVRAARAGLLQAAAEHLRAAPRQPRRLHEGRLDRVDRDPRRHAGRPLDVRRAAVRLPRPDPGPGTVQRLVFDDLGPEARLPGPLGRRRRLRAAADQQGPGAEVVLRTPVGTADLRLSHIAFTIPSPRSVPRRRETPVRWRLIPRDEAFFESFVKTATEIRLAATLFQEMVAPDQPLWDRAAQINDVEHRCDDLTRDVLLRLHRTFVTPIDREDIHALALALDDVADAIDDCAKLMQLYRLDRVRPGVRELARILADQTAHVEKAMEALRDKMVVAGSTEEIDRLEHEGDVVYQESIVKLFDVERDPIQIIKWKELYGHLEAATDRCEDIGNVLDGISVKHA